MEFLNVPLVAYIPLPPWLKQRVEKTFAFCIYPGFAILSDKKSKQYYLLSTKYLLTEIVLSRSHEFAFERLC